LDADLVMWSPQLQRKAGFRCGALSASHLRYGQDRLLVGALAPPLWQSWLAVDGRQEIRSPMVLTHAAAAFLGLLIVLWRCFIPFAVTRRIEGVPVLQLTHNLVPKPQNWEGIDAHLLASVFSIVTLGILAYQETGFPTAVLRRIFLVLTAGFVFLRTKSLFPTLSRQDDLPFIPARRLIADLSAGLAPARLCSVPKLMHT